MARFAVLTPITLDGTPQPPIEIDLRHILWMEECVNGTVLFMDEPWGKEHPGALINTSMCVAESEHEILWQVMD